MQLRTSLLLALFTCIVTSVPAAAQNPVVAAWTQIGRDGSFWARIVTRGPCPDIEVDGKNVRTHERAAPARRFDVRTCQAPLSQSAHTISVADHPLPAWPRRLQHIAFLGDTGCRIEIVFFQACNDPAKWPFPKIAQLVAAANPDLIVHLGDYYYRETPCLVPACSGSPHGNSWRTWAADFFTPAAPMLARAPLLAIRGNHEDCVRGGEAWERFLSVYGYGACSEREPAYTTTVGGLRFFVLDASSALDPRPARSQLAGFRSDFARLRSLPENTTWLLSHKPMWALEGTITGGTLVTNRTLEAAEGNAKTLPIELSLSGHIHLFAALQFADGRAPQIVVGTGGDTLANQPAHALNQRIDGTYVSRATVWHAFGFALFNVEGKSFDVYDRTGKKVYSCTYGPGTVDCKPS